MNKLPEASAMHRLVIVGSTSSGKTTLAGQLSRLLTVPHVELDALHWDANWTEAADEVFRQRMETALSGASWVVDGNYSQVRDLVWQRADTLIWLDYSLPLILARLTRRSLTRVVGKVELWNGNRESWRNLLGLSGLNNSLYYWAVTSYRGRKRDYTHLLSQPEYQHLKVNHFHRPKQTAHWLATLQQSRELSPLGERLARERLTSGRSG